MRAWRYLLVVLAGLFLGVFAVQRTWMVALASKTLGAKVSCPWSRLIAVPISTHRFHVLREAARRHMRVEQIDDRLGIERIQTAGRAFWIKKAGNDMDGPTVLEFVSAEQQWIAECARDYSVRPGEVVVDVGAHVGTFGDDAFRRGAAKVVMVEPDPVNVECIRRNFAAEIAQGKVVVVPEGAWSKSGALRFSTGVANSGTGSFVLREDEREELEIPVRPLDDILRSAGVERVDFIKMDIEGAEREALRGAAGTLARWKPRLMLDMYHRPDDDIVLPRIIAEANPAYRSVCSVCSVRGDSGDKRIVPYAMFFY